MVRPRSRSTSDTDACPCWLLLPSCLLLGGGLAAGESAACCLLPPICHMLLAACHLLPMPENYPLSTAHCPGGVYLITTYKGAPAEGSCAVVSLRCDQIEALEFRWSLQALWTATRVDAADGNDTKLTFCALDTGGTTHGKVLHVLSLLRKGPCARP